MIRSMENKFSLPPRVVAGLEDKGSAWRFIELFARSWTEAAIGDRDGYPSAQLDAAEQRLGRPIPPALREAYERFGRRQDIVGFVNPLKKPLELYLQSAEEIYGMPGVDLLIFRADVQGAWSFGIDVNDLESDDPAVIFLDYCGDESCELFGRRWLDKVSAAVVELVLAESLITTVNGLVAVGYCNDDEAAEIKRRFPRLGLPSLPLQKTGCDGPTTDWHMHDDAVLIQVQRHPRGQTVVTMRGRRVSDLETALAELPRGHPMAPHRMNTRHSDS